MSKFFSKNEDTSSSEDSSEEEAAPQKQVKAVNKKFYNEDYEEEEQARTVTKTTDKRAAALLGVFDKMKNHIKISDFTSLQGDFEEVQEEISKCIASFAFASDKLQTLPSWVIKGLITFEDSILDVTPEEKKKMNKTNAQSYTKCKTKLKKYLMETGDHENLYVTQLEKYRADPPADDESEEEQESGSGSDSSDDSSSSDSDSSDEKPKKKAVVKKAAAKGSSSSSSDSSSSGSDSDSSSDSDSDGSGSGNGSQSESDSDGEEILKEGQLPKKYAFLALPREQMTPVQRRWKWVAFDQLPEDMKLFINPPSKKRVKKTDAEKKKDTAAKADTEIKEQPVVLEDDKDLDFTKLDNVELIITKYKNQQTSRKNFDIDLHIDIYNKILVCQAENLNIKIEVTMLLVTTYFLAAKKSTDGFFSRDIWLTTNKTLTSLLDLVKNKVISNDVKKVSTEDGGDIDQFMQSNDQQILPALVNFIEKLDQQLYKAFQCLDKTSSEYLFRLRDECLLIRQCDNLISYLTT